VVIGIAVWWEVLVDQAVCCVCGGCSCAVRSRETLDVRWEVVAVYVSVSKHLIWILALFLGAFFSSRRPPHIYSV